MSSPRIDIALDSDEAVFPPGGLLSGEYTIDDIAASDVTAVELSVLWHTEGKGDEDLMVHHFERAAVEDGEPIAVGSARSFSVTLPLSPYSYDGQLVKIRWCVRVRVFCGRQEEVAERPFQLGIAERPRVWQS